MPTECLLCVFKLFSLSFYVIKAEGVGFGLDWGFLFFGVFFVWGFLFFVVFFFLVHLLLECLNFLCNFCVHL